MSRFAQLTTVVLTMLLVAGTTPRNAEAQAGTPQQLATIGAQLAAIESSLNALATALARIDPTVPREVTLATGSTYAALGTSVSCSAVNVSDSPVTVVIKHLNISGTVISTWPEQLGPGQGNGISLNGAGGAGPTAHMWCKFEYTGPANAVRAHLAHLDFTTGIARAVYEAR